MDKASQVLIVGAGPTGLVLALQLLYFKIPFRIIDKKSEPGAASRAMAVQARTLEFYDQMGIADEVIASGIKMETFRLRSRNKLRAMLKFADLGHGISPFPFALCYPQDDHERLLVAKLRESGIEIEWDTELKDFAQDSATVTVTLALKGNIETSSFSYICGCDGAYSAVREGLRLDFPGGTYEQMFYVADVKLVGEFSRDITVSLAEKGLGLVMPVRSSGMQRLIGIVPGYLGGKKDVIFTDLKNDAEKMLGIKVEQVNWFSTYRVHHRVAERFKLGRCFIAGDAGHIHSPAGGQGMNTGIGDAINLAWKLAEVIKGKASIDLLQTYEAERIAFAKELVASTDRIFSNLVSSAMLGKILREFIIPYLMPVLVRFVFVRRLMFRTISQVRVNYHKSILSIGRSGNIKAGDRLPWNGKNYEVLRSRTWQLHIYGKAKQSLMDTANDLELATHIFKGKQNIAYLVRPDGYIGLVLPTQQEDALKNYVNKFSLKF